MSSTNTMADANPIQVSGCRILCVLNQMLMGFKRPPKTCGHQQKMWWHLSKFDFWNSDLKIKTDSFRFAFCVLPTIFQPKTRLLSQGRGLCCHERRPSGRAHGAGRRLLGGLRGDERRAVGGAGGGRCGHTVGQQLGGCGLQHRPVGWQEKLMRIDAIWVWS